MWRSSTRAAQLRETGLRIANPHGDATVLPKLVIAGEVTRPFDIVFLAVKGFQLEAVLQHHSRGLARSEAKQSKLRRSTGSLRFGQ